MNCTTLLEAQPCLSDQPGVLVSTPRSNSRFVRYLVVTLVSITGFSAMPAFADDPCKTVLCMYGRFTGNSGGSECNTAEQDYFDIIAKKHGKINWGKTSTLRGEFLNSCPSADSGINKKINDKFGKSMG